MFRSKVTRCGRDSSWPSTGNRNVTRVEGKPQQHGRKPEVLFSVVSSSAEKVAQDHRCNKSSVSDKIKDLALCCKL